MQDVELEDVRAVPVSSADLGPSRSRVRWWWFPVVAAVVVAALVGYQALLDQRERTAVARFAAVPGVVLPVDSDVQVLWRPTPAQSDLVQDGLESDGAFVGLSVADDGSQAVIAVDQRTGDVRWSTPVAAPDATRAQSIDGRDAGRCAMASTEQVVCLVGSGPRRVEAATSPDVGATTTPRVVVVDTRDGRVVADHAAAAATSIALLPGLAVLGAPGADVTAQDLLTGEVRWRYAPPGAGADLSQAAFSSSAQVFSAGDLVGVTNPGWSVGLLNASGELVRTPIPAVAGYRYDAVTGRLALLSTTQSGQFSSTLVAVGRDDVDLTGTYLDVAVDDGSVPDLVLTSDGSLRGWDARTGASRWTSDETATGSALVLRGRVYVPTMTGTVALDARTGEIVWRSIVTPGHVPGSLATDGTELVVADQPVAGTDRSELVALDLDDGHARWHVPMPDGVRSSSSVDRVLLGLTADGVVVLG